MDDGTVVIHREDIIHGFADGFEKEQARGLARGNTRTLEILLEHRPLITLCQCAGVHGSRIFLLYAQSGKDANVMAAKLKEIALKKWGIKKEATSRWSMNDEGMVSGMTA